MAGEHDESASARIAGATARWPGVTVAAHRFGGVEFRLGRRELGHLHGDSHADLPFPRRIRDQLIADGRAQTHRWLPDSGWVTVSLRRDGAVDEVIALLHDNYERAAAAAARRNEAPDAGESAPRPAPAEFASGS